MKQRVLESIETDAGARCVDIFVRVDGTYGFEEYRRDAEDARGWFPVGHYAGAIFGSADDARAAARVRIAWLT